MAFLILSASAGGQQETGYKYRFEGMQDDIVLTQGSQTLMISYSIASVDIRSAGGENGNFYRISIPGHLSSVIQGRPELPVYSRLLTIPDGFEYSVKISDVRSTRIRPSQKGFKGLLYPAQESETKTLQKEKPEFVMDRGLYSSSAVLPFDTVTIEPLGTVRNKKLANLYIAPVRYNPGRNILEVITSMKIEIRYSSVSVAKAGSGLPVARSSVSAVDKSLMEYDMDDVVPGFSTRPMKMVILTDTAFKKQLSPFFRWKIQKGFDLKILYRGAGLAGTTYAQLKDTLTKIYNAGTQDDPPPGYLLIIGDISRIPKADETNNVSDMYYGEYDGEGDYMPELFIGRIPAADTGDARSVVSKIIQYEKFEFADTNKFYSRALITAGNDITYQVNMNGQLKYVLTNYLKSSYNIQEHHFYYPESTNPNVEDSIKKLFTRGISFINYTGHGDASGWLDPVFRYKDVDSLKNKNMYPFVISNACRTSQFSSQSSLGTRMVMARDKGAVGFIGCSNDSYWDEDFFWAVGAGTVSLEPTYQTTGLGAYDRFFHKMGEPPGDWYFTMGQINYAGNMAVSASTSARKKYYWETYNLVGDPSVIPITGSPGIFSITLPDTIPNGMKSMTLTSEPFSYIAISHFDTLWDASHASASGTAELTLPGRSNDSCLIVVTGQNRKPVIRTIRIANVHKEYISLSSYSINDNPGNNDKKVDFGETFFLNLGISNLGMADASNLYAKITTASGLLSIETDSVFIGTLNAKTEKQLTDVLRISVSGHTPDDMETGTIDLLLKDSKTQKHYRIDICIHAPELSITNCIIDDTTEGNDNGVADPGETFNLLFKVSNQGSSNISGQFYVNSNTPDLSVLSPSTKSGELRFGEITDISVPVKLSESAPVGSFVYLSSMLDCSPWVLSRDFSFRAGRVRENFESQDFNVFPWINVSPVPWVITTRDAYDLVASAKSGQIPHGEMTSLMIRSKFEQKDSLRFWYKVSSEPSYDNLAFYLNDSLMIKASGELPWTKAAVAVEPGVNSMEWRYSKDQSVSGGYDAAWIDLIDFSGSSPVSYIQKDIQVARIVSPVQKNKLGREIVTLRVLNTGKDTISSFNLGFRTQDYGTVVTQTFDKTVIPYGDSVTVSFNTRADLSGYGSYDFSAYAYDNNDDYLLNDTLSLQLNNEYIADSVRVYPNPFSDQITLYVQSDKDDRLRISLMNSAGAKIRETERDILTGMNTIVLSWLDLSSSAYYLRITGSGLDRTIPLIKMKN